MTTRAHTEPMQSDKTRGGPEVTGQKAAISHALVSMRARATNPRPSAIAPEICYVPSKKEVELSVVLKKAANRAIGGGIAGAAAMAINVSTLM